MRSRRTFADLEYEAKKRRARRGKFPRRMEELIPWERPEERMRPFYHKAGRGNTGVVRPQRRKAAEAGSPPRLQGRYRRRRVPIGRIFCSGNESPCLRAPPSGAGEGQG